MATLSHLSEKMDFLGPFRELVLRSPGQLTYLQALLSWGLVWTGLLMLPPGLAEYRSIVRMNMVHGLVAAMMASATIIYDWNNTWSTAASVAFFVVDATAMLLRERGFTGRGRGGDSPARWLDYAHHVIGALYGTYLLFYQGSVCSPACPAKSLYTYAQTNEFSTPFYGWYRLTKSNMAGGLFALTFFLSRIVFNSMYLLPYSLKYCSLGGFIAIALPYQTLQVVWMGLIIRKVTVGLRHGKASAPSSKPNGKVVRTTPRNSGTKTC